jgi:hypothetical protein
MIGGAGGRNKRRVLRIVRFSALSLALFAASGCDRCEGCAGCGAEAHLAELAAMTKTVQRDFANSREQWQEAARGDRFAVGDGLRTGTGATARLRLVPEGEMLVESETVVRFQDAPPGERARHMEVETGSVEIESGSAEIRIRTVVGMARIEKGSRVRVRSTEQRSRFEVVIGKVEVDAEEGTVPVPTGEELTLEVGGVVIEPEPAADAATAEAGTTDAAGAGDAAADAKPDGSTGKVVNDPSWQRGPTTAALTIAAGESAIIHDPRPPTNVRISFPACPEKGLLEVRRANRPGKWAGTPGLKSAAVRLPPGGHLYRVRCLSGRGKPAPETAARGRLFVKRDPGLRRLPRKVPSLGVEADGRVYTVRYQNLLPRITFSWPDPPSAKGYVLEMTSRGKKGRRRKSKRPRVAFRSGQIAEGTHAFHFATTDGRRSPEGKLRVVFDNVARAASLSEPAEGKTAPGQRVTVAGTALTNSTVSIGGNAVPADRQGRFQIEMTAPTRETAIAVRVMHGSTGIHYYLRNLARPR